MSTQERETTINYEKLGYMVTERPDFGPTQVKSPKELRVGQNYLFHRAARCLELGHEVEDGREYEAPLEVKILNVNQQKARKIFDWLTDIDLEVDGRSIDVEFGALESKADDLFISTKHHRHLSMTRAGLAPDIHGDWHKYNWIEDLSKKERVAREINISPILNSEKLILERYYKDQTR
jgi:hypothetical protein